MNKYLIKIRDFFLPWNVVKLKKLDRSWQETDTRMEASILQLLVDHFHGQQPFHGWNYQKNPTWMDHQERLYSCDWWAEETKEIWQRLLMIAYRYDNDWYEDPMDVFLKHHERGATFEEAQKAEKQAYEEFEEDLLFVVKNRNLLWT